MYTYRTVDEGTLNVQLHHGGTIIDIFDRSLFYSSSCEGRAWCGVGETDKQFGVPDSLPFPIPIPISLQLLMDPDTLSEGGVF